MLPLHIFEHRYRLLVREARDFGVVLIRKGREVGPGQGDDVHRVGTLATFEQVEALPDGRFLVVARGIERIRVLQLDHSRPYLMGRVERLPDPPARAHPRLLGLLESYLAAHGVEVAPQLSPDQGKRAVWLVGSMLQTEAWRRQQLLEECDPELAERLLREELAKLGALGKLAVTPPGSRPETSSAEPVEDVAPQGVEFGTFADVRPSAGRSGGPSAGGCTSERPGGRPFR